MNIHYAFALINSVLISILVAGISWRRRTAKGAIGLVLLMITIAVWALTYSIRWLVSDLNSQYFWLDATYLGVTTAPTAFMIMVLQFTNRDFFLTRRNIFLLSIEPILTMLFIWTDPLHGFFYNGMRTTGTILSGGIWFWVNVFYSYGLLLLADIFLIQEYLKTRDMNRHQVGIMLVGMLFPWLSNIIGITKISPFSNLDLTPIFFVFSGLIFTYGLFRFHLLDLVPIARHLLVEIMRDGVVVLDRQQRIIDLNPSALQILGLSKEAIGQPAVSAIRCWPDLQPMVLPDHDARGDIHFEGNRRVSDLEIQVTPLMDPQKTLTGWLINFRNITERKQILEALRESEERFRSVVRTAIDAIITTENGGKIISWNQGAQLIFQYTEDEILNQPISFLLQDLDDHPEQVGMKQEFEDSDPSRAGKLIRSRGRRKNGTQVPIELSFSRWQTGEKIFYTIILRDITERQQMEEILQAQSTHDVLTGLYNRQWLENEMVRLQTDQKIPISILMIDVDGLKGVNDTWGHAAGDDLLRRSAELLRTAFRREDVISRFGGDEFVAILPETTHEVALKVAQRLRDLLREYNRTCPAEQAIYLSIGAASNDGLTSLSEALQQADQMMYVEKMGKKESGWS